MLRLMNTHRHTQSHTHMHTYPKLVQISRLMNTPRHTDTRTHTCTHTYPKLVQILRLLNTNRYRDRHTHTTLTHSYPRTENRAGPHADLKMAWEGDCFWLLFCLRDGIFRHGPGIAWFEFLTYTKRGSIWAFLSAGPAAGRRRGIELESHQLSNIWNEITFFIIGAS